MWKAAAVNDDFQPIVHYANRLECKPGERFGPRIISDYQWLFVQRGSGHVRIGGHRYRAQAGLLLCYGPGVPHEIEADPKDPFVLFGLHFTPHGSLSSRPYDLRGTIVDVAEEKLAGFELDDRDGMLPSGTNCGMWPLTFFEELVEEYNRGSQMSPLLLRGIFTQLAARLLRWIRNNEYAVSPLDRQVAQVKERLIQQAEQAYDPVWLSLTTAYSVDYTARLFKERVGMAPHKYHMEMKLAAAKRLLEQTDLSSTQIAERLSLGSVHYFCKWFKRFTGEQPLRYRERTRIL
ncbi:helix-turn-helix domain-containing protein [Paenibacillus solisilvae]|uniref:Helix-turn-helix domain-containing protein n=1 Tax=Paenibacillus solisilvae TaxID=2486751 RepID=A0ABW0W2Z1_9BACL